MSLAAMIQTHVDDDSIVLRWIRSVKVSVDYDFDPASGYWICIDCFKSQVYPADKAILAEMFRLWSRMLISLSSNIDRICQSHFPGQSL